MECLSMPSQSGITYYLYLVIIIIILILPKTQGNTKIKSCSCSLILDIELVKPRLNSWAFSFSKSGGSSTNVDVLESLEVESHLLLDRLRFNLLAEWYIWLSSEWWPVFFDSIILLSSIFVRKLFKCLVACLFGKSWWKSSPWKRLSLSWFCDCWLWLLLTNAKWVVWKLTYLFELRSTNPVIE